MKFFRVQRDHDPSGVSGTGHVADAVEFDNGKLVICWCGPRSSVNVYDSLADAEHVHGHAGATRFVPVPAGPAQAEVAP